jgi:hypothetical protein
MSGHTLFIYLFAGFVGLAGAMMLVVPERPAQTLEQGLGPTVLTEPL